ncbi:MAG: hypothetical protein ACOX0F_01250 [Syntrophomonadaceae bacterium]|jgi:hypothetical protein
MPAATGRMELWRRVALLLGILIGLALFFYVAPAMVSVTSVDWEREQADELKSISGYVSAENKRLNQLPLADYIHEKSGGKGTSLDPQRWEVFFQQVQLASKGQYDKSLYGNRVSEMDKDDFWKPQGPVPVFFKPEEIPFAEWGLNFNEGEQIYISRTVGAETSYLLLRYEDYQTTVTAMSKPYRIAPGWLYHPYRLMGLGVMVMGLLLYIFLPRHKRAPGDIGYAGGRLVAGDLVAVILLLPFYGLPYLVNRGTVQAFTGLWPITAIMWTIAVFCVILLYYNAWYASYRIELTPEALFIVSFKGIRECPFRDIAAVNIVSLSNPGWFRKLILAVAILAVLSGRRSSQPMGSAMLTATAAYGGIEICRKSGGKPVYIWATDQMGGIIIYNIDRVLEAFEGAGVVVNQEPRDIEGFSMLM